MKKLVYLATLCLMPYVTLNAAYGFTLKPQGSVSFDESDNGWFAHAGIQRAGYASPSTYIFSMDHDMSTGISLGIYKQNGDLVFKEDYPKHIVESVKVYEDADLLFIRRSIFEFSTKNTQIDIIQLSTKNVIETISPFQYKNFYFNKESKVVSVIDSWKTINLDLSTMKTTEVDHPSTNAAFTTKTGVFYIERVTGQSKINMLNSSSNLIYSFEAPHSIVLKPEDYSLEVLDDRYLIVSKPNNHNMVFSVYDLKEDKEIINAENEKTSVATHAENSSSIAFSHDGMDKVTVIDFDNHSITTHQPGNQYMYSFAVHPENKKIMHWVFPGNRLIEQNPDGSGVSETKFDCQNTKFSNKGSSIACLKEDSVVWSEIVR